MVTTTAQKQAVKRYDKKTYSFFGYRMKKDYQPTFEYWLSKSGLSKNGFIDKAVKTYIRILELKENQKVNENNS